MMYTSSKILLRKKITTNMNFRLPRSSTVLLTLSANNLKIPRTKFRGISNLLTVYFIYYFLIVTVNVPSYVDA